MRTASRVPASDLLATFVGSASGSATHPALTEISAQAACFADVSSAHRALLWMVWSGLYSVEEAALSAGVNPQSWAAARSEFETIWVHRQLAKAHECAFVAARLAVMSHYDRLGEAPEDRALRGHVDTCGPCRAVLREFEGLASTVSVELSPEAVLFAA